MSRQQDTIDRYVAAHKAAHPELPEPTVTYKSSWYTVKRHHTNQPGEFSVSKCRQDAMEAAIFGFNVKADARRKEEAAAAAAAPAPAPAAPTIPVASGVATSAKLAGYLTWWTIHQGNQSIAHLRDAGSRIGIPAWMVDAITGSSPESAWLKATHISAKGKKSQSSTHEKARYLTRDAGERVRLLIRETVDANDLVVKVEQIGILHGSYTVLFDQGPDFEQHRGETNEIIRDMQDDMETRVGKIDDARIRTIVLRWLQQRHRVCARGTGGVYYIPQPQDAQDAQRLQDELVSIRTWISECGFGSFSVVELHPGGVTAMDDLRDSAVEELEAELEEVSKKLDAWSSNDKMNDGSRMFSASAMVEKLDGVNEKLATLQTALEMELGTVSGTLAIVRKRALAMQNASSAQVQQARNERSSKKSGTVKERAAKSL